MKLQEYQSKEWFASLGIPVPPGKVAESVNDALEIARELEMPIVVKAQVLVGGRGKAGGVKLCRSLEEVEQAAKAILGMDIKGLIVKKVLVAHAVDIDQEYYFGITLDRTRRQHVLMLSPSGGIDIEEVAEKTPEKIFSLLLTEQNLWSFPLRDLAFQASIPSPCIQQFVSIAKKAWQGYQKLDASLLEINPLALTADGRLVAVDAKMIVDDNALFRQEAFHKIREEEEGIHPLEKEAKKLKLPYVKLNGNIGIIGNGAGLVMATMDLVKLFGGKPANFLDIGGGAKEEVVRNALKLVLSDKDVRGIFFNVFGGITRGDEVARGIIAVFESMEISVPFVLRMAGTRAEEGIKMLREKNISAYVELEDAAKEIVSLVKKNTQEE